jgi:hypothetical protein
LLALTTFGLEAHYIRLLGGACCLGPISSSYLVFGSYLSWCAGVLAELPGTRCGRANPPDTEVHPKLFWFGIFLSILLFSIFLSFALIGTFGFIATAMR